MTRADPKKLKDRVAVEVQAEEEGEGEGKERVERSERGGADIVDHSCVELERVGGVKTSSSCPIQNRV